MNPFAQMVGVATAITTPCIPVEKKRTRRPPAQKFVGIFERHIDEFLAQTTGSFINRDFFEWLIAEKQYHCYRRSLSGFFIRMEAAGKVRVVSVGKGRSYSVYRTVK